MLSEEIVHPLGFHGLIEIAHNHKSPKSLMLMHCSLIPKTRREQNEIITQTSQGFGDFCHK